MADPAPPEPVDEAVLRLSTALDALEAKLDRLAPRMEAGRVALLETDVFMADRARLAADLDKSKAREKELEGAAEQASAALTGAIAQVRSAMGDV